jgi:hypothetical protein
MPGRIVAWTIGLAPVLLLLLTWGETFEPWQIAMRSLALPIVVAAATGRRGDMRCFDLKRRAGEQTARAR